MVLAERILHPGILLRHVASLVGLFSVSGHRVTPSTHPSTSAATNLPASPLPPARDSRKAPAPPPPRTRAARTPREFAPFPAAAPPARARRTAAPPGPSAPAAARPRPSAPPQRRFANPGLRGA